MLFPLSGMLFLPTDPDMVPSSSQGLVDILVAAGSAVHSGWHDPGHGASLGRQHGHMLFRVIHTQLSEAVSCLSLPGLVPMAPSHNLINVYEWLADVCL